MKITNYATPQNSSETVAHSQTKKTQSPSNGTSTPHYPPDLRSKEKTANLKPDQMAKRQLPPPISKLPPDILKKISSYCIKDITANSFNDLINLRSINKEFHQVAHQLQLEQPQLGRLDIGNKLKNTVSKLENEYTTAISTIENSRPWLPRAVDAFGPVQDERSINLKDQFQTKLEKLATQLNAEPHVALNIEDDFGGDFTDSINTELINALNFSSALKTLDLKTSSNASSFRDALSMLTKKPGVACTINIENEIIKEPTPHLINLLKAAIKAQPKAELKISDPRLDAAASEARAESVSDDTLHSMPEIQAPFNGPAVPIVFVRTPSAYETLEILSYNQSLHDSFSEQRLLLTERRNLFISETLSNLSSIRDSQGSFTPQRLGTLQQMDMFKQYANSLTYLTQDAWQLPPME